MKLRNKKTGEIIETLCEYDCTKGLCFGVDHHDGNPTMACYDSLAELNEDWEDYEEPKEWWYIDIHGPHKVTDNDEYYQQVKAASKEIGNYFETKEEAEKAVEKLKAWKRLKDKGFRFTGINDDEDSQELITQCGILCEADIYNLAKDEDFLLLFGGEE